MSAVMHVLGLDFFFLTVVSYFRCSIYIEKNAPNCVHFLTLSYTQYCLYAVLVALWEVSSTLHTADNNVAAV